MNRNVKYLIIGAGISGLTFANFIKDDYLIIEKENEVGGYCRTIKKGEYLWDYAGHFFHFKTDEMKKLFEDLMKDEELIFQEKNTKIYYGDRLIDYPFQMNIHQLPQQEFIDCLYDLYNKNEKENYESFLDMLYGKFGKSIVEKFLKPYNEKLYACDLNNLDKDAMGRFFPYANLNQIINNMKEENNNSYNNTFLYPKNGAGSFLNKLYENLDKEKVELMNEIKKIDLKNKTVITKNDEVINYQYLINTSPLNNLLELIDNTENLRENISYNKVLVFNLGFEKKSNFKEHWIYFPQKDINFYRVGFYDNILMSDKLSMYIEIGYEKKSKISEDDIKEQLNLTLQNLKKVGIVEDDNKLVDYSTIVMNPAYVHINSETNKEIKEFEKYLNDNSVYTIGRYGAWTYCSMEDCMISAKELAEKLK
ncbi:MAG TPA: FAD-dependent oxidoreductase [Clostridiaceae bacterium]|nr:FAD-dependent oxidoreductase [Clostridiaceae bacterium]